MPESALVPVTALVMAVGAVGTIVPLVPGLALIWAAALVYGLDRGFDAVGVVALVLITGLAMGATAAGYVVPRRRAVRAGVTRATLWLGIAGAVIGFFAVPIVGLPLGGVVGIFLGEHVRTRDHARAWRATRATLAGFGVAALVQLSAALGMIAVWAAWVVAT